MNYNRESTARKQKQNTSSKLGKKLGFTAVRVTLLGVLAAFVMVSFAGFGIIKGLVESAPDISNLSVTPTESATYILDSKGNQIQKLTEPTANRTLVKLDQVPEHLQHAVIAVEDSRFYQHNGIDIQGIVRAFLVGVTSGTFSEGASTITQQLLKNNVFTDWTEESSLSEKFKRKFQEQYLALELEKRISKEQILEDYLNTINLGAGAYGVQAAAKRYFNKDVSDLTLSESTVIAGITQNPTAYNPIMNPNDNATRRKKVLGDMLEQEYISKEEYDAALADNVYDRIQKTDVETGGGISIYSYYVDAMIDQVMDDLQQKKGLTYRQAYKMVYSQGLRIFSAQDQAIQKICDEEFENPANFPSGTEVGLDYALSIETKAGETIHYGNAEYLEYFQQQDPNFNMMYPDADSAKAAAAEFKEATVKSGDTVLGERVSLSPQPQASVVIMDQSTGYVKAIVGGRGKKEASLTFNRATVSRRQPGSTFKVLTTYAPALDSGTKTLASTFYNAPYAYSNGVEVRNWDSGGGYSGMTNIREGIYHSVNIVAVKCLTEITPRVGFEAAEKFGISTLYDDEALDVRQPLALGGVTDGVVNLELTGGFAAIANKGQYNEPKFYTRIEDSEGNLILDNSPVSTTVIKDTTAFLLTNAMQDVLTRGTATSIQMGDMPTAGKSGTTSSYKDIWFVGYTPYYTCGVWGGYDNHEDLPNSEYLYHSFNKVLWASIMQRIHADLPVKDFEQPEGIVRATVCKKSGKIATELCSKDPRGSMAYTEYFAPGTVPTETCDMHVELEVCKETKKIAVESCEKEKMIFLKLPEDCTAQSADSEYVAPDEEKDEDICEGHTIVDKIKDFLTNPGDIDEIDVPDVDDPGDGPGDDPDGPGEGPGIPIEEGEGILFE